MKIYGKFMMQKKNVILTIFICVFVYTNARIQVAKDGPGSNLLS